MIFILVILNLFAIVRFFTSLKEIKDTRNCSSTNPYRMNAVSSLNDSIWLVVLGIVSAIFYIGGEG